MASVYIARESGQSGVQRTVALKVMHEHLARNREFKNRFLDEARVLTQIAHPFVCRVVGYGDESGCPFMAMEYLVGEPLSRVLRAMKRRGPALPAARRARYFARVIADLAEGLHAAHEARDLQGRPMGVVHRDITPHNLFLLYDGTVRVLDFGIARFADRNVQTVSNALLGKLPYMAPEQMQGERYDRRVDVWALGVVLWELVTLERLFKRETELGTMRAVCADRIPTLAEFAPDLPPGLDGVLEGALRREPSERYSSARAFGNALELWLAGSGPPVTAGNLSEFLTGFFPGSQLERQRWAQVVPSGSGVRRTTHLRPERIDHQPNPRSQAIEPAPDATVMYADVNFEPEFITARHTKKMDVLGETTPLTQRQEWDDTAPTRLIDRQSPASPHVAPVHRRTRDAGEVTRASGTKHPPRDVRSRLGPYVLLSALTLCLSALGWVYLSPGPALGNVVVANGSTGQPPPLTPTVAVDRSARPEQHSQPAAVSGVPLRPPSALAPSPASRPSPDSAPTSEKQAIASTARHPSTPTATNRSVARSTTSEAAPKVAAEVPASPPPTTGDVLIVSSTPGIKVFLGARLLGTTPVKTRLPAGTALLSLQAGTDPERIPMLANIAPGRLNMLNVNLGKK